MDGCFRIDAGCPTHDRDSLVPALTVPLKLRRVVSDQHLNE
jgi:hypothetical protein